MTQFMINNRTDAWKTDINLLILRVFKNYSYTDQRKVETDVEVTEDRTGDPLLRKPRTSQLELRLLV